MRTSEAEVQAEKLRRVVHETWTAGPKSELTRVENRSKNYLLSTALAIEASYPEKLNDRGRVANRL
jgi:hypothetical protein